MPQQLLWGGKLHKKFFVKYSQQGFSHWGDGGSHPHQPKICSFPPVDLPILPTKFLSPRKG